MQLLRLPENSNSTKVLANINDILYKVLTKDATVSIISCYVQDNICYKYHYLTVFATL